MYVDEAGIDDNEDYAYGYSPKGRRFYALKGGHKTQRISMMGALNVNILKAPLTFEGYCNTQVFEAWVEQGLVPILEEGQVVIMDNASFHKSKRIEQFIKAVGCELIYLPPYSPDFNKIEHKWAPLKNRTRKNIPLFKLFREAVDQAFL